MCAGSKYTNWKGIIFGVLKEAETKLQAGELKH